VTGHPEPVTGHPEPVTDGDVVPFDPADVVITHRLRVMANAISRSDRRMEAVLTAAADEWAAGRRGRLTEAVIALADDVMSQLPLTMQTYAAGGEAAARLAVEAERQEPRGARDELQVER